MTANPSIRIASCSDALSPAECEELRSQFDSARAGHGETYGELKLARRSTVVPLRLDASSNDQYTFFGRIILDCERAFGVRALAVESPQQLTRYEVGDFFDWHVDSGRGLHSTRRVSISIQLCPTDAYAGGDLVISNEAEIVAPRACGSIAAFLPTTPHKVTRVERGTRFALVFWLGCQ